VGFGGPAKEIVAAAATADPVVMTSHGCGAVGRFVLGSVADWVARHAPVPTLIVCSGERPASTTPLTRIVVPLDGSPLAEAALAPAVQLASDMGLPVHLVRIVDFEPVRAAIETGATAAEACATLQGEVAREARATLDDTAMALRNRDCTTTDAVRIGDPADELLAAIRTGDLVVLATHARAGLDRWLQGSVAEALVRHAACPVLLVRAITGTNRPVEQRAAFVGSPS
jgi:nucleotide-binding universal stress UspA family protein